MNSFASPALWLIIAELFAQIILLLYGLKLLSENTTKLSIHFQRKLMQNTQGIKWKNLAAGFISSVLSVSSSQTVLLSASLMEVRLISQKDIFLILMGSRLGTALIMILFVLLEFYFPAVFFGSLFMLFGFLFYFYFKNHWKVWGQTLLGLGMINLAVLMFQTSLIHFLPGESSFIQSFLRFNQNLWLSIPVYLLFGMALSMLLQSALASASFILLLATIGLSDFSLAIAFLAGSHIGTSISLFYLGEGVSFNVRQVSKLSLIQSTVYSAALLLFLFLVFTLNDNINVARHQLSLSIVTFQAVSFALSALLTYPFAHSFTRLIIPNTKAYELPETMKTQSMAVNSETQLLYIEKDLAEMAQTCYNMLLMFMNQVESREPEKILGESRKLEDKLDGIDEKIHKHLNELSLSTQLPASMKKIREYFRIVENFETAGDRIFRISLKLFQKQTNKIPFHKKANEQIINACESTLDLLNYLSNRLHNQLRELSMDRIHEMEKSLDEIEQKYLHKSSKKLKKGASIEGELLFMEIIQDLEKIADLCFNIGRSIQKTS